ncbi:YtxH domain-containing protein [Patescibacteria group bacterium]|nr:YtxH domain-containing protein [Patescibacteria group bacterium]
MGKLKKIFKAGLFGTILGSILGVLFAKKPGEETRAELKDKIDETKDKAVEAVKQAADKIETIKEEVKSNVEEIKKVFKEKK